MTLLFPVRIGKIRISIFAIAVVAAAFFWDFSVFTAEVLVAAALHECGHLLAMKYFGAEIHSVMILPYGAVIYSDTELLPYKKEAAVALSGAVFNILFGLLSAIMWMMLRDIYTLFFSVCSLFLAFVNLIPVPTLDGARAIEAVVLERYGGEKGKKIMDSVYYFAFLGLVLLCLYVIELAGCNLSLVIFLCCVFIGVYARKEA